jgi:hypothetical protein
LLALKAAGSGINVFTFQFVPSLSLDTLKTSPVATSFSGTDAYCSGKIGNFIWNDPNGNGCQDPGEALPRIQLPRGNHVEHAERYEHRAGWRIQENGV